MEQAALDDFISDISSGNMYNVGSGYPKEWSDLSYTLRAPDVLTVHYVRSSGKVTELTVTAGKAAEGRSRFVRLEGKDIPLVIAPGETVRIV